MTLSRSLRFALPAMVCLASPGFAQVRDEPLRDGDRVLVKIWTETQPFFDTARVQPEGKVILPRIGTVTIAGLPAAAMQDSVRRVYSAIIRDAPVEVTALRKVTVFGEVRRPGVYYLETHANIRDAIALAGGVGDFGVSSRINLIRNGERTRLSDWQNRNDDLVAVRSGDVVVVDRESWVKRNAFTVVSGTSVLLSIILALTQR
jgi:polysaccharide export outer membrane protein